MGIFGIGVSGLNAAQAGILVTGQNISNASTPGYSRQAIVQAANPPQATGSGFFGQGTTVQSVQRMYNVFLTNQLNQAQSQSSQLSTYSAQVNQIESLLGTSSGGFEPAIQAFFAAVQGVANNPSDVPSRQAMLSASQTLVSTFQSISQQLSGMQSSVNGQITSSVTSINSFAQQIAALNQNILDSRGKANNQPPNDLLDQRDQLIAQLSKEIQTTVVTQSDGTSTVLIGSGQGLVVGNQVMNLSAVQSPTDPSKTVVASTVNGVTSVLPDSSIAGGNLGGLYNYRTQSLDVAQNALGRIAVGLAQTFNQQQQIGQDLNGNLGKAYFNVASPAVFANASNTSGTNIDVALTGSSPTTNMSISAKLSQTASPPSTTPFDPANPATYNFSNSSTIYDNLGLPHTATYYFVNAGSSTWKAYTTVDGVSADPPITLATQYADAQAAAAAAATKAGVAASQISAITGAIVYGTSSSAMAASASNVVTTPPLTATQQSAIFAAVNAVQGVAASAQTNATQLAEAKSTIASAAASFGATPTEIAAMTGALVSGTTPAQMAQAVQAVASGPGGLSASQAATLNSVITLIPDVGTTMTPATQLSSILASTTAVANGFGATSTQLAAISNAIYNAEPPTSSAYATAAQTAANGNGMTPAQAAGIFSTISLVPATGTVETAASQLSNAQSLATAAANAFGASAAQVSAITTAIAAAAPGTTSALANAASTAATGQGLSANQAAAIAAAVNAVPNSASNQTGTTQLNAAKSIAAAMATAFGATAAEVSAISAAVSNVPPSTTAAIASAAQNAATTSGLTASQAAAIASAINTIPDSGATQSASNQLSAAEASASAIASAFGASSAGINAITTAIGTRTSAQMASSAQTAATAQGLSSAQASALSSVIGLIPDAGTGMTQSSQLAAVLSIASSAATGLNASSAQVTAITTAINAKAPDATANLAQAAQTAATANGLSATQAAAIAAAINTIPNSQVTQDATSQLASAQAAANAMATAFGANASQIAAIANAIATPTSSQLAQAAQTVASGPGGLNAAQAAAVSSLVGLVPATGSVQTAQTQLLAAQGSITAMGGAFGATATQINSIAASLSNGQTSAQMAASVLTAATNAGLTSAQAQAISNAVALVPDVPVTASGTDPTVLQFDSTGALLTGAAGPTNVAKTIKLQNGAAPLSFNADFSQVSLSPGLSVVGSVIQNGTTTAAQLTGDDYVLHYSGGVSPTWSLLNMTTNQIVPMTGAGTAASPFIVDGMRIIATAPTDATKPASFTIKPTVNGAQDIALNLTDTSQIAAASPIKSSFAAASDGTSANSGTAVISAPTVNLPLNASLQDPVTIAFNNPASTYTVTDTKTGTVLTPPGGSSYTPGAPISFNGWTVSISGTPAPGDSFTVGPNTGGVTDNSNALLLSGLQTKNTLIGNTASYEGAFSQLVSKVSNISRQMQVTSQSQTALVNQLTQSQQSVSGVNLDEEAANLMRYQQAYQAAGKMLQIANTLFQSILQL